MSVSRAVALGGYRALVEPNDVTDARHSEAPTAVAPGRGRIALAEPIEDVWKELGIAGNDRVGRPGLEPGTYGLKVRSSTD